jgi:sigma-E factor negative regulatory protein RseA
MQEEINKKMSQFLDDELDQQQALSLLKTVRQDTDLKNKMARYQAVKQVLKSDDCLLAKVDLVDRVQQQIKPEAVYFMPPKRAAITWKRTSLAIAASLAIVAVLVPKSFNNSIINDGNIRVVAQQEVQPAEQAKQQYIRVKQYPVNHRFNDYLQAHSNSVYTIGASNYQPYARVAGYSQGR